MAVLGPGGEDTGIPMLQIQGRGVRRHGGVTFLRPGGEDVGPRYVAVLPTRGGEDTGIVMCCSFESHE